MITAPYFKFIMKYVTGKKRRKKFFPSFLTCIPF